MLLFKIIVSIALYFVFNGHRRITSEMLVEYVGRIEMPKYNFGDLFIIVVVLYR